MAKNKKKRKNAAAHQPIPPPARPTPMDGRRFVSYDDLETGPAPPVPRHMVSYADSDDDEDDSNNNEGTTFSASAKAGPSQHEGESTAERRHRIMSRESDGTYDANRAQPRTDPTYGQVGAFPGLDTYQYAPFYGPANDGIDYLRMVRSEAREIPHIVTSASRKREYEEDEGDDDDHGAEYAREMEQADAEAWAAEDDGDGYYEDGAYVAKPLSNSTTRHGGQLDPQMAYYDKLKLLYARHRERCQAMPLATAVAALDESHPISLPKDSPPAFNEWRKLLVITRPLPAQLCSMDKWTVWRLLRLCERHIRNCALHYMNIPPELAQWIWGLLGRLQESWQMRNEEISKIRELGKCATWCLEHYMRKQERDGYGGYAQDDGEDEEWDYGDEDGEASVHEKKMDEVITPEIDGNKERRGAADEEVTAGPDGQVAAGADEQATVAAAEQGTAAARDEALVAEAPYTTSEEVQALSDMLAAKRQELASAETQPGEVVAQEQDGEAAKLKEQDEKVPNSQTRAVLDLIITVTGECYGQRDLLWTRPEWQLGDQ